MIESFQCDYPVIHELLKINEELNHIYDIYSLLDKLLYETRLFLKADAGSIYLVEGNNLRFSYVQNDTLYENDSDFNKNIYADITIPIGSESIAGYAALTGKPLNIPDVYNLPEEAPYTFNRSFDEKSSYETKSILTIPLITGKGKVTGVMQIINKIGETGSTSSFSEEDVLIGSFFSANATVAIERAIMNRESILRMVRMSGLRDPKETGSHVNRVGSYAVEIYHTWARKQGISNSAIRTFKDNLRVAAMLHDVGKVAIPDSILKKNGSLSDEEYAVMKTHSYQGYQLFNDSLTEVDKLSADVILYHHEKYNGTGYPRQLRGEEIPLGGRIVAIADVYDALINRRAYKEPWDESRVLETLQSESGKHFDPNLMACFFECYDVIKAIGKKYSDNDPT
jgi:HD-GYP domain-containing protein (c-di-GMP phosphodiesterase class II)